MKALYTLLMLGLLLPCKHVGEHETLGFDAGVV